MVYTATASSRISPEGLYFQIVCDPGHERTLRELSQLPKESRERVWADMIGANVHAGGNYSHVESFTNEDNHHENQQQKNDVLWLEQQLSKLNDEITVHSQKESAVIQSALQSKMGKDPELRLAFLRACDFDTNKAAQRMCRHFAQKISLFGESKLGRSIRLADLSSDDLETLQSGAIQFLPRTDRGGRLVLVARNRFFVYKRQENMLRALWYMLMSTLDTPHLSDAGLVVVGYDIGDFVPVDYELTRKLIALIRELPIRIVASHSCYNSGPMEKVADLVVHMVSSFVRLRLRMHYGSHQECRYRLLMMGIPVDLLPFTSDDVVQTENHRKWLQFRIRQEQKKQKQEEEEGQSETTPTGSHILPGTGDDVMDVDRAGEAEDDVDDSS